MFKYKSLIVILLSVLVSCTTKNQKIEHEEESCVVIDHQHVLNKTDSILVLADEEFKVMKQHKMEQKVFVDSLEYTIKKEQFTINDLNNEVKRISDVDKNLQLTKEQLERALITCKNKEKELIELNEKFALKSEQFMDEIEYYIDREVKLVTIYRYKIDSLVSVIDSISKIKIIKKGRKNRKS